MSLGIIYHHPSALSAVSISFVAAGSVASGSSPTVDIPTADLQSGDLLVLTVCSGGDTTTPSGWTLAASSGSGQTRIATYYKISDGTETDFTLGNSQSRTQCGVVQYRATGGSFSYDGVATNSGLSTIASTSAQTISTVPGLILSHFCKAPNADDIGTVSGTNQRLLGDSDGSYTNLRVVDEFPESTGSSTVRFEAPSYNNDWITNALLFSAA
ncbi:MAG: hypothetical protein R3332_00485 [Pseudohongiellaceae bacterium]|nr:hypothetical protein [Pseudohongiellaceae bacterium]